MSTREIAEKVGCSQRTVVRDIGAGDADASPAPAPEPDLTGRERKVLELKEKGATDSSVAEELGVSTKTVQRAKVDIATKQTEAVPATVHRDIESGASHEAPAPAPEPDLTDAGG